MNLFCSLYQSGHYGRVAQCCCHRYAEAEGGSFGSEQRHPYAHLCDDNVQRCRGHFHVWRHNQRNILDKYVSCTGGVQGAA